MNLYLVLQKLDVAVGFVEHSRCVDLVQIESKLWESTTTDIVIWSKHALEISIYDKKISTS